eukprot:CAMPEP_0170743200 /NCGR_PEP_ID=MMETSP0437-20130122/7143_1 /TAXON_ID=0 /ORGANISM="Sexangularia sp." /LENGTH=386 /DNA_ID=CAMNT_0011081857 /DNA_START=360 /DNA_END=1517 /DNA_ORIENTATION=-
MEETPPRERRKTTKGRESSGIALGGNSFAVSVGGSVYVYDVRSKRESMILAPASLAGTVTTLDSPAASEGAPAHAWASFQPTLLAGYEAGCVGRWDLRRADTLRAWIGSNDSTHTQQPPHPTSTTSRQQQQQPSLPSVQALLAKRGRTSEVVAAAAAAAAAALRVEAAGSRRNVAGSASAASRLAYGRGSSLPAGPRQQQAPRRMPPVSSPSSSSSSSSAVSRFTSPLPPRPTHTQPLSSPHSLGPSPVVALHSHHPGMLVVRLAKTQPLFFAAGTDVQLPAALPTTRGWRCDEHSVQLASDSRTGTIFHPGRSSTVRSVRAPSHAQAASSSTVVPVQSLVGHTAPVRALVFDESRCRLYSASDDGQVIGWWGEDEETGRRKATVL